MTDPQKRRPLRLAVAIGLVFMLLAARLFDMQFRHGAEYAEQSQSGMQRTLRVTGTRGSILDTNGLPLAYDKKSYNVEFAKDPGETGAEAREKYTGVISQMLSIIRDNGGTPANAPSLAKTEDGAIEFSWGITDEEAIAKRYDAWRTYMLPSQKDRQSMINTDWDTPAGILAGLREYYFIPESATDEEALEILGVWQQVQYNAYRSYIPIVVAENVNMTTVSQIEMASVELPGVTIAESTVRVYPKGTLASNVLGYLGYMNDAYTIAEYEEMGYSQDDLIGVAGIESTMETYLTGNITQRTGQRVVEVDSLGKVIREFPELSTEATAGNDVILTIDADLQKVLEDALAENIAAIRAEQEERYLAEQEEYDQQLESLYGGRELNYVKYGAAVVMNVQTGQVLGMASYPGFDPNLFIQGMTTQEYNELFADNPLKPLLNKAISSRDTPGSVYKMAVGLAGLMSTDENGDPIITLDTTISDEGMFTKHLTSDTARGPRCWVRPYFERHADLNITSAIRVSCNYFFFDIAYRMGIEQMDEWIEKLGLGSLTNIELPGEVSSQIANQESLYDPSESPTGLALLVYRNIRQELVSACQEAGLTHEDAVYDEAALAIMALVGNLEETREYGADVRLILRDRLELPETLVRSTGSTVSAMLYEIIWNDNRTITAAIGQDVTLVTPIAVARYVSALINGGNVYDASIVKAIVQSDGTVLEERRPQLVRNLDVPDEYLAAIKEGMREVVSLEDGGTAGQAFENFKYKNQIGGKTGTGQVTQIDLENNCWMTVFAPYEDPEICVVVYIPNGIAGDRGATTVRAVVEYYLDEKYAEGEIHELPQENSWVN